MHSIIISLEKTQAQEFKRFMKVIGAPDCFARLCAMWLTNNDRICSLQSRVRILNGYANISCYCHEVFECKGMEGETIQCEISCEKADVLLFILSALVATGTKKLFNYIRIRRFTGSDAVVWSDTIMNIISGLHACYQEERKASK